MAPAALQLKRTQGGPLRRSGSYARRPRRCRSGTGGAASARSAPAGAAILSAAAATGSSAAAAAGNHTAAAVKRLSVRVRGRSFLALRVLVQSRRELRSLPPRPVASAAPGAATGFPGARRDERGGGGGGRGDERGGRRGKKGKRGSVDQEAVSSSISRTMTALRGAAPAPSRLAPRR